MEPDASLNFENGEVIYENKKTKLEAKSILKTYLTMEEQVE